MTIIIIPAVTYSNYVGTIVCTLIPRWKLFSPCLTTARAIEIALTIFLSLLASSPPFFLLPTIICFLASRGADFTVVYGVRNVRVIWFIVVAGKREGSLWKWVFSRGCSLYIGWELNVTPTRIISFRSSKLSLFLIPSEILFSNDTLLSLSAIIRHVIYNISMRNKT